MELYLPKISIVTINYNNYSGLKKTMDSVYAQNFSDFEYIIIDGGSVDGSREHLINNSNKLSYWSSEKDNGIYDAMNKGIQVASGKYIMFLNSGDYLVHENVLLHANMDLEKEDADIYYGNIEITNEENALTSITYPSKLTLDFWELRTINHQAAFIKTLLFTDFGLYQNEYKLAADYFFFLKCFFYGKRFVHINETIVHYLLDGNSNLNREEYLIQMKTAWKNIIPEYLDVLYRENKEQSLLMKHKLMIYARKLNHFYNQLKVNIKNINN